MHLKHRFHSPKGDGSDSTLVRPSNWNDEHDLLTEAPSVYLGQDAAAAGQAKELPIVHAVGDDFTMYTKAAVDAAIAAAVAAFSGAQTGDITGSLASSKSGWLLLTAGQSIGNAGSGAAYANANAQALFTLMWGLNGNTWPISPTRGVSAAADWASTSPFKVITLPDARGCVLGMLDYGRGLNGLLTSLGGVVGAASHMLTEPQLPPIPGGYINPNGVGPHIADAPVGGTGQSLYQSTYGAGTEALWLVQPTMGVNLFIKL